WKEKWIMAAFWGLNIGLMGMIVVTLAPIGVKQALENFRNRFWTARSVAFYQQPVVQRRLWRRIVPESIFIVPRILQPVGAAGYGVMHLRKLQAPEPVVESREEELVGQER